MLLSLLLSSFVVGAATAERVVVTSGRVVYDAFGRAAAIYHPTVDRLDVSVYSDTVDAEPPTVTEYDVLDRPVKVTYPDSTFTETAYGVADHVQVVTVTDALGNESKTHVDGSGRTVKSIRFESPGSQDSILTEFFYDGIGRLVSVRDAEGNVTTSVYDMADRRLRVTHPASGEAVFTYDALGNMLTMRTASGDTISYCYELGRLKDVLYPKHPEYNVHYHYGGPRHPNNAGGRVRFREDATGGIEYSYDQMGNVSETLRTVVVPNDSVGAGTFRTGFKYDAFGKLLKMTYPDGEVVCYLYDGSGQLVSVYIYDYAANDRYVAAIGYDKFGDRVYMRYGNGTETFYRYDNMRRLDSMYLSKPGLFSLGRTYEYDDVGNIIKLTNTGSSLLYPPVIHRYEYDGLYRLTVAHGNFGNTETGYDLSMSYDKMYRITGKTQTIRQTGIQFPGTLKAGYNLAYTYDRTPGRCFRMSAVTDVNYRTEGDPVEGDSITEEHFYEYDPNGNILRVNTSRVRADGGDRELTREEMFRWDEENRLMAISQDGYVSNYWYDADGERVIKEHGNNQAVFVNSWQDSVSTDTRQFTIYPSAYLTVHNGNWYTNHIYIGSERIASHLGTMDAGEGLSFYSEDHSAGAGMDKMLYSVRSDTLVAVMASNYAYFGLPYNGKNRMVHTPLPNLAPSDPGGAEGGMRYYWMMGGAVEGADGNGVPGRSANPYHGLNHAPKYFYHSDHLGSSSLITDSVGNVAQQLEYLPYGEVFLEKQRNTSDYLSPYRFNGKELDEETGLYYYGARYMNPRLSIWYATDPMQEKYVGFSTYSITANNPIILLDDDGESFKAAATAWKYIRKAYKIYKKTGKLTPKSLKQAGISEIIDIAGDLITIFDGDASMGDKISAGVDLLVGTDFNNKGQKAAKGVLGIDDEVESATKTIKSAKPRIFNISKSESKVWNSFQNARHGRKCSGTGKNKQYYEWDHTHNDIEIYDYRGNHLGSMDPTTGEKYKDAVKGRKIKI